MPKKGYIPTIEHRKKLSLAKIGKIGGNKGKHWKIVESKRKNMARNNIKHVGLKGDKSNLWKGGINSPERILWRNRQRRIKRLGNGGSHTLEEWETLKAQYNWTCPCCRKTEPTIILTVDHVVPLYKGGSDNIENIQPLCGSCNSKKATKTHKYELPKSN